MQKLALALSLLLGAGCTRIERHEDSCTRQGVPRGCFCDGGQLGTAACYDVHDSGPCQCGGTAPDGGIAAIETSGSHTCAVVHDLRLLCWGDNQNGQLGDGTKASRAVPGFAHGVSAVAQVAVAGGTPYGHTCVAAADGGVSCFGRNAEGEIGDGTTETRLAPRKLELKAIREIRADTLHTCARDGSGQLFCWGLDESGQLGIPKGSADYSDKPKLVPGLAPIVTFDVGWQHTCAVDLQGAVYCWGLGTKGELGDATLASRAEPRAVDTLQDIVQVQAGYEHTCALDQAGAVHCFGANQHGQLGNGTHTQSATPTLVLGLPASPPVVQIAVGYYHGCALDAAGDLYCWGDNRHGQLGDGTTEERTQAVRVTGVANVSQLSAGGHDTCVLLAGGEARCFGDNSLGQLGDGTMTDRRSPTPIRFGSRQASGL